MSAARPPEGAPRTRQAQGSPVTHALSLHHVTVMDVSPADLVSIAAQVGCKHVCFFTHVAPEALQLFPCAWTDDVLAEVLRRCEDTGVTANSLEYFDVYPDIDLDIYRKGLEIGARLGARCATTHVKDPDPRRAIDNFGRFCDIAAEFGISAAIEFTTLAGPDTLAAALEIVAGAGRSNGGIAVDTLHLFRTGGTVAEVSKIAAGVIKSIQLSDGPLGLTTPDSYLSETLFERRIPGEGEFPLRELMQFMPADMVVDVEVPMQSLRAAGISALDRARRAVDGARRLVTPG